MGNVLTRILGMVAAIGGILAMFFRGNAFKAKAEEQEQRADVAEAAADVHRKVDAARTEENARHKQERQVVEQEIAEGRRDHLDNNG